MRALARLPAALAATLLAAGLAGCLSPAPPDAQTLRLDVPAPADLLPTALDGRALGFQTPISPRDAPFPRLLDGHTRIFDGAADGVAVQTVASAMRFEDEDAARDAIARIASEVGGRPGATRPTLGDEAIQVLLPPGEGSSLLAVRKGPVLWMVQDSATRPGVPPGDLAPIIEPYVARIG